MKRSDRKAARTSTLGVPAATIKRATQQTKQIATRDSLENFAARLGLHTDNLSASAGYDFNFTSRNRVQLEAMYRTSWIVGQMVDAVADDMTRAGIELGSQLVPKDKDTISNAFERMSLWDRINDTSKWSRLYGGAIAVMLIDGQDMSTPLRPETVGPGQFKGLYVLDRWLLQPSLNDLVSEFGPDLGMPRFYDVVGEATALRRKRIHYSRVLRMDAIELPYFQKITENLWGQSVVERLFDRLVAFDSATTGAAQLVAKAHLRTYLVKGLRKILAGQDEDSLRGFLKNVDMIRKYQSIEGLTLIDTEDGMQIDEYTFGGLDDVLLQLAQQLAGATQIPLVRLFGQPPAGLNSSGDADLRTYYDGIAQKQERQLRNPLTRLLHVVCRSELGKDLPDGFSYEFRPLWQLTTKEKAEAAEVVGRTVGQAVEDGLMTKAAGARSLRDAAQGVGVFHTITDKDIEDAENEAPPVPDATLPNDDPNPDSRSSPAKPKPGESERPGGGTRDAASPRGGALWRPSRWLSAWRSKASANDRRLAA